MKFNKVLNNFIQYLSLAFVEKESGYRDITTQNFLERTINLRASYNIRNFAIPLIILFCTYIVFYSNIHDHEFTTNNFWSVTLVFSNIIVHLLFLIIVLWKLVLKYPPYSFYKQRILYPFLLVIAYVFYFAQTWIQEAFAGPFIPTRKIADAFLSLSYLTFIILYSITIFREYKLFRSYKKRPELAVWIIIDTGILLFLFAHEYAFHLYPFIFKAGIVGYLIEHAKEAAVWTSIFMWFCFYFYNKLMITAQYHYTYAKYIEKIEKRYSNDIVPNYLKKFVPLNILAGEIKLLDFGCGNGIRTMEVLQWLNDAYNTRNELKITTIGYDLNNSWEPDFRSRIDEADFIYSRIDMLENVPAVDVFSFSHVQYTLDAILDIKKLIKRAKPGSVFIFRGNSPRSMLYFSSYNHSIRMFNNRFNNLWIKQWLKHDIETENLKRVNNSKLDLGNSDRVNIYLPDLVLKQYYALDEAGIEYLVDFLKSNFGNRDYHCDLESYLYDLMLLANTEKILCDDFLYTFIKKEMP